MPSEILDEISKNNDKIYLVTKKAGEEGEKNIWGPIMIQDGGEDDFRKEMEKCVGVVDDTGPGIFKGILGDMMGSMNVVSGIVGTSLFSLMIASSYFKYHHNVEDGYINNKDSDDSEKSEEDNIENFENFKEYQESRVIDWLIMILSIANIGYALKGIIGVILYVIWWILQKIGGKSKSVAEKGMGAAEGTKEAVGKGIGAAKEAAGKGIGAAKEAVKAMKKGEGDPSIDKIVNPLNQAGGGRRINDALRWIVLKLLTNIPSLIQFFLGIYFLDKSYASLYP